MSPAGPEPWFMIAATMSRPDAVRLRPIDLTDVHVLVVDDYEDALELFRSVLHGFGAKVLTARNARDALTVMKAVRVHALVSDLAMPGEDGLWLVQQLRQLKAERGGSIPAVAITAHRERYTAERVQEFGFGGVPDEAHRPVRSVQNRRLPRRP